MSKRFIGMAPLALMALLSFGCQQNRVDLVQEGIAVVDHADSDRARLAKTHVWQDGDVVIVYGCARRPWFGRGRIPGHVEVTIESGDRQTVHTYTAAWLPKTPFSRQWGIRRYVLRVPLAVDPGTRLTVTHHPAPHGQPMQDSPTCRRPI